MNVIVMDWIILITEFYAGIRILSNNKSPLSLKTSVTLLCRALLPDFYAM